MPSQYTWQLITTLFRERKITATFELEEANRVLIEYLL